MENRKQVMQVKEKPMKATNERKETDASESNKEQRVT